MFKKATEKQWRSKMQRYQNGCIAHIQVYSVHYRDKPRAPQHLRGKELRSRVQI